MTFCSVAVVDGAKTSAINTMGEKMNLERIATPNKSSESTSEAEDLAGTKNILINGKSQIIETDIMATNGVMHVVDSILDTDSSLPLTSMLQSRNLTYFKTLLELNGIVELVDSYENVSVFAPTNAALESSEWVKRIESDPDSLRGNEDLTKFLKYHIAKPLIKTCDLTERTLDTETGDKVRVNLYSTVGHLVVKNNVDISQSLIFYFSSSNNSIAYSIISSIVPPLIVHVCFILMMTLADLSCIKSRNHWCRHPVI